MTTGSDWEILWQEIQRPVVVVGDNARHVNFWKTVCGEGMSFVSTVQVEEKTFISPWASLEFRGLQNALVLSEAEPDENDLEFLEMQEALEDYVVRHSLFAQAAGASRVASRLPWLMKNKFVDALPKPVHTIDILRGLRTTSEHLPATDITFKLPPQYSITTLLVAGHLLETRFNHWMWRNIKVDVALTSLGAAFRQVFYLWETNSGGMNSAWSGTDMDEVAKIGIFLGRQTYMRGADRKFRRPGLNTSFWEAAILGPVSGSTAETVLAGQRPDTEIIGGTILSVGPKWFAKIRSSNIFGTRLFDRPYDDFPFPTQRVDATHLTETEQRLAFARAEIPPFELTQLQFGRVYMSSSLRTLYSVLPNFPPGTGMPDGGRFRTAFLQVSSKSSTPKVQVEETSTKGQTAEENHVGCVREEDEVSVRKKGVHFEDE